MALQVIGAGFGRTGTLSLKLALERLGLVKCYHMLEVGQHPEHVDVWRAAARGGAVDWDRLFDGYRASVDWPSCNFWAEQLARYPDARVILTERDPVRWHESVMNTIYPSSVAAKRSPEPVVRAHMEMVFEVIWDGTFDGRIEDREYAINRYLDHNRTVRERVPAGRLLVLDVAEGWAPLCGFLDCAVPNEPFPRVNTTEDFQARVKARAEQPPADAPGPEKEGR